VCAAIVVVLGFSLLTVLGFGLAALMAVQDGRKMDKWWADHNRDGWTKRPPV